MIQYPILIVSIWGFVQTFAPPCNAWQLPLHLHNVRTPTQKSLSMNRRISSALYAENEDEEESKGGLMSMESLRSQLVSAFTSLDESDQYDAVLTGLCAKILDNASMTKEEAVVAIKDPVNLLEEMNGRRMAASGRSLMALIDAAVTAQDAKLMSRILSLCSRNGGVKQYGNLQTEITPLPISPSSKVKCPDGSTKTRAERLATLPDIPTDERGKEVVSALAVAGVIGFCGTVNVLGIDEISIYTNVLWAGLVIFGTLDNFYDILKFGATTFGKDKIPDLPEKLPLSLGSGQISGTVVKGFNRLLQIDTERECECEAAAFFAAYTLGLPCFSFRPNSFEAAVLVGESTLESNDTLDPLLTSNGLMKVLVWLMAPVAMESMKHPQLIQSDPREAEGLLTRLEKSSLVNQEDLWWLQEGPEERLDLLKWAYTEADLLLRRNQAAVTEVSQRLTGGAATVGDCVAAVENW